MSPPVTFSLLRKGRLSALLSRVKPIGAAFMAMIKRILLLAALLLGALLCYQAGFATGTFILVISGMLLELGFWLGIYKWEKARPLSQQPK